MSRSLCSLQLVSSTDNIGQQEQPAQIHCQPVYCCVEECLLLPETQQMQIMNNQIKVGDVQPLEPRLTNLTSSKKFHVAAI